MKETPIEIGKPTSLPITVTLGDESHPPVSLIRTPAESVPSLQPVMVFRSAAMHRLYTATQLTARRDCTAIVLGEPGTGKELVARQLHLLSDRADRPFVAVDCRTLNDPGMEKQFFGSAGDDASQTPPTHGFIRTAHTGTLYLDEIGDMPLDFQARLMKVIKSHAVVPIGASKGVSVDVRIIASTHRDIEALVKRGRFREDLFFWLHVVQLRVPPLRERIEDVVSLAEHFVARISRLFGEKARPLSSDALEALQAYNWPDNVRELAVVIEQAISAGGSDCITANDLPDKVRLAKPSASPSIYEPVIPLAMMERNQIAHALRIAEGNQSEAARLLQIQRQRLYRKIENYRLQYLTRAGERAEERNRQTNDSAVENFVA